MTQKLESQNKTIRRVRAEFDTYSDSILLTEIEAAGPTGFSHNTLKFWRVNASEEKPSKGPTPVFLYGQVRYSAGEIRRWRASRTTTFNNGPHAMGVKARANLPQKTMRRLAQLGLEEL